MPGEGGPRSPGAIAERIAAAGVLRHSVGTTADGTTGLQSLIPVVRGAFPDDPVWAPTTFTKNRDRLQKGEVFTNFMTRLLRHPQVKPLLSDEHFSVDGTL